MIYLLHDDLFGEERLDRIKEQIGPPDVRALNTTQLDGQRLTLPDLRAATEVFPFLAERRLVIVRRLFGKAEAKTETKAEGGGDEASDAPPERKGAGRDREFLAYFGQLPETTDLVLIEDPTVDEKHPATKRVREVGGEVVPVGQLQGPELERWIGQRVRAKGGRIDRRAIEELAQIASDDLRRLDLDLDRLVTYAGGEVVEVNDVRHLVADARELGIFDLVDAIGNKNRPTALRALRQLLDAGEAPAYLLVMITRQFRLIALALDALRGGAAASQLAGLLKMHPRVAEKVAQQSRHFSVAACAEIYQRLAQLDLAMKTSQTDEAAAIEVLVVELTEPRGGQSSRRITQTARP